MTRNQKVILGVGGILVTAIILMLLGIIPGLTSPSTSGPIKIEMWGVGDRQSAFEEAFSAFSKLHSNVSIRYTEKKAESYETDLVNALAAGKGPDIIMIQNTWLPKHYDKLAPMPTTKFSMTDLRNLFPRVIEQDFAPNGTIYGLPLYIDTLALLYNKDIFDNKAIAVTPKTWEEVQAAILKIRVLQKNNLKLAGAAIGGSQNINSNSDLMSLLMLQTGVEMTDKDFTRATFAGKGLQSLDFYIKFSDPKYKYYTWNNKMPNSLEAFASGQVAMIFNYASNFRVIKEKNPFLRIGVGAMPQPANLDSRVDFPNYYGFGVSLGSKNKDISWDFIKFLTTNPSQSAKYLEIAKHSPALRSIINTELGDDEAGIFAKQALTARSWPQIDNKAIDNIFSEMIESSVTGALTKLQALQKAENAVTELMAKRQAR